MTQEVAVRNETPAIVVTDEQRILVKRTLAPPDATDSELELFFFDCARQGVHPLDRLIHFTKRKGKYTPITSIDMFRMRASDTGEHVGTDEPLYAGVPADRDFSASVTVYRLVRGQKCAFTATARWSEYYPGKESGFMWDKMPHLMLGKCAEALAIRKAFPKQLHGIYIREEMDQAGATSSVPEAPVSTVSTFSRGKMTGKTPAEVETGYLQWYADKVKDGDPALATAVHDELAKRLNSQGHEDADMTEEQAASMLTSTTTVEDCQATWTDLFKTFVKNQPKEVKARLSKVYTDRVEALEKHG